MNLPNALSLLRIFLVTPFLVAVSYRQFSLALIIFALAGISDFFDGYLARRWGQQSMLGTLLDPLGDKLLTTVAFISLCLQGFLPPWLAVTVVAKDVYIAIGTGVLYFAGNLDIALPSLWGKLSTLLQLFTVGFVLLFAIIPLGSSLLSGLFAITGLATAIAFGHYLWRGTRVFSATSHSKRA